MTRAMTRPLRSPGRAVLIPLAFALSGACDAQDGARTDAALQAAVDSLVPRLEELSGLERRAPLHFARRSREDLRAYVEAQMEDELPPEELAGIEASYRALGLLADTLDLRPLLLDLYMEQVVGYYDPEADTLFLLDDVPASGLRDVLAHELVHALQDQHTDLEGLVDRSRGNDRQTAAQAAVEGHATLVMLALALEERSGGEIPADLLESLVATVAGSGELQGDRFPELSAAPAIVRKTLLFPYLDGLRFAWALWGDGQGVRPAPLGERLPQSTEQVLAPRARFLQGRDAPTEVAMTPPGSAAGADGWSVVYENTLGQLEMGILLEEHLGAGAERLAQGWDGDRFRLLAAPGGGHALVWYSVWDDAAAADRFADAYRRVGSLRTGRSARVERLAHEGRPLVLVVDADASVDAGAVPLPGIESLREDPG